MNSESLQNQHRRLILRVVGLYFILTAILIFSYLKNNKTQWTRLARSYASSSRHSLITSDYRDAVATLSEALNDGFSSVAILKSNGELVLALPNDSVFQREQKTSIFSITVPIASESEDHGPSLFTLRFHYSGATSLYVLATLLSAIFLSFVYAHRKLRTALQERQFRELKQGQMEFQAKLAAQVAHDIRSPVGAIRVASKMAENLRPDILKLLNDSAARIEDIANDLLSQRRAAVTTTHPEARCTDLLDSVRSIFEEKRALLQSRAPDLKLDLGAGTAANCRLDKKEFCRALSNLINNATEATETGKAVNVVVRQTRDTISVIVSDEGKGIPTEVLERLGETEISYGKSGGSSGNGLGIIHAKSFTEKSKGRFSIQSVVGMGTIVTMRLPVANVNLS